MGQGTPLFSMGTLKKHPAVSFNWIPYKIAIYLWLKSNFVNWKKWFHSIAPS